MSFVKFLISDPNQFILELERQHDYLSLEMAQRLDAEDPLGYTAEMFDIGKIIPFAGHSLGPSFKPALKKIVQTVELQRELHAGHFPNSHPEGKQSGHWFDCDRFEPALRGAQQLLGFKEDREFNFTASGLSANLGMLVETFYRPKKADWDNGKTKVAMLGTEFFSDQAIVHSVVKRAIKTADDHGCFESTCYNKRTKPTEDKEILKIQPDKNGLYRTEDIIAAIRQNAKNMQMLCLPDIVFSTGQRLELDKIFAATQDLIKKYNIKVILDLAHTVGNRPINLESMPVTAAVGCGYKHLCGYAGSSFGIYVNRNVNLAEYPPLQGWKAADGSKVFKVINQYDPDIMEREGGATAFRTSNPPPVALIPVQSYLAEFGKIGFDKLFKKSECLTRYLIAQLQKHLGGLIDIVTPLNPKQRGATIAIRVKGGVDLAVLEEQLKESGYEVDTRPPNIIRMTAHYGYTKFAQIYQFVKTLKNVLEKILQKKIKAIPELKIPPVFDLPKPGSLTAVSRFPKAPSLPGQHPEVKTQTSRPKNVVYLHR